MRPEPHGFSGRLVVVTGAAHGLGRAMARAFAEGGATVLAWDIREKELTKTAAGHPGIHAGVVDVTDPRAVSRAVRDAESGVPGADRRAPGAVHILVNNAGGVLGQVGQPVEAVSPEAWREIVEVNLSAAFYTARAVVPGMKRNGWGRIVNISSGAGLGVSLTGIQAYAAAKAGQIGLTRQLAHELGPAGITVNCVAPGFVRSNPDSERQWKSYGEEGQARILAGIARRRLGTPADITAAVLFLASDAADWITGQVLPVDGGR